MRSKSVVRMLAGLLIASMLPALVVPSSGASNTLHGSYARWIRAQLRVPADASVDEALARASESDARTFEEFVAAFFDAYEAQHAPIPLSKAFTDQDLSNDALISFLQRRFTEIAGDAVPPRIRLTADRGAALQSAGSDAVASQLDGPPTQTTRRTSTHLRSDGNYLSLRTVSDERPQGP